MLYVCGRRVRAAGVAVAGQAVVSEGEEEARGGQVACAPAGLGTARGREPLPRGRLVRGRRAAGHTAVGVVRRQAWYTYTYLTMYRL